MSDEAAFLSALKANPADDTTRLVYADWLDEHEESRKAQYLRLVVTFATREGDLANTRDHKILLNAAKQLQAAWREVTGGRFSLILDGYDDKLSTIRWIREVTGFSLGEAKEASEDLPYVLFSFTTFERAQGTISRGASSGKLELRVTPSDLTHLPDGPNYELVAFCYCHAGYEEAEARAALITFLAEALDVPEAEVVHQAILNTGIPYATGLTRDEAQARQVAIGKALPQYDPQRRWWLTVTYQRRKPVKP